MEIQSCAEKENFSSFGIKPGACINAELIKKLWGLELAGKDKNQRPHCLCCKSVAYIGTVVSATAQRIEAISGEKVKKIMLESGAIRHSYRK
jgi:hypothetical protein